VSDWTAGYVADIGYTFGYYAELNPLRVKLAFLNAGLHFPEVGVACELGFGQGVSANIHAAASVTAWYGTDFNPAQASFAQELSEVSGANAKLYDESFADFANRDDLPDFDYIGLHGIWSWISDENRGVIVDFIRRKLKVGGVLYISYNTQPGWAAMVPMRDLLTEHSDVMGRSGMGIVYRIDEALVYVDKLIATNPAYLRANPQIIERINKIKEQNRNYIAHEYFNKDWLPMPFSKMAEWLASAKVQFACSAHYLEHIDSINLTVEQQVLMQETPDAMFRQTVRDFMVNQQFRKDYWVKGARALTPLQRAEKLREQKIMLMLNRNDVSLTVTGSLGEAKMTESIYSPILDILADHKAYTFGQIEQKVQDNNISFAQLNETILLLASTGVIASVQDDHVINKAKKTTEKLNFHIMNHARGSTDIAYLSSPVTGGGVMVNRFTQLFLLATHLGKKKPVDWAEFVWEILVAQGQKIVKNGEPLNTKEENIDELLIQANTFAEKQLPIFKALQL
jgi:SAM-dependent methyltransferase